MYNGVVLVHISIASIQGLVGSDDTYSSTLYIVGQDRHFNSDMGSQNKFQLHEELVCENQKYEAYIQLTCGSVDVKTSLFDFSELFWVPSITHYRVISSRTQLPCTTL